MVYIFLLVSIFTGLAEGLIIKRYNERHTKGGFIMTAMIAFFSMLFYLITDKNGFSFSVELLPYSIIAAFFYSSASLFTFVALGCGSYAMSMLILSYSLVFSIGYGLFFLKEEATVTTYIGLFIVLISLFLTRQRVEDTDKEVSLKWLICIGYSMVGSGLYGVISRMQQFQFDNRYNNEFLAVSIGLSAIALFIIGVIKDRKDLKYILKNGSLYAIFAGAANGATNMLGMVIATLIAVSLAAPISAGAKIIFSFLLSKFIFKEHFLKRQVVGVVLGAVALVFLNL